MAAEERMTTFNIEFDDWPDYYVAVKIHKDYLTDPVVVGMTMVQGIKDLRKHIEKNEDDGA